MVSVYCAWPAAETGKNILVCYLRFHTGNLLVFLALLCTLLTLAASTLGLGKDVGIQFAQLLTLGTEQPV